MVCVGMSDVTAGFGLYDLSKIAEEYKSQAKGAEKDVILPERVGGSRVHLLLGIKNTNLDPVLIKVLPTGNAVYLSPFKDIYGSRMIFAGPHKSFTKSDNGLKMEMTNAVFFMKDQIHETLEIEPEMRCFSIVTDKRFGTTINPYPINEDNILDCEGENLEQFEDSLDDHEKLLNLLEDSYSLCNVHTAQINVQRFREVRVGHEKLLNLLEDEVSHSLCNVHTAQISAPGSGDVVEGDSDGVSVLAADAGKGVAAELLLQGVHKAHAPIAKFRNALNDEELEDKMC